MFLEKLLLQSCTSIQGRVAEKLETKFGGVYHLGVTANRGYMHEAQAVIRKNFQPAACLVECFLEQTNKKAVAWKARGLLRTLSSDHGSVGQFCWPVTKFHQKDFHAISENSENLVELCSDITNDRFGISEETVL